MKAQKKAERQKMREDKKAQRVAMRGDCAAKAKQQSLPAGEGRRNFMKNCMGAINAAPAAGATSATPAAAPAAQ
jgi:hypothetical protein